MDALNKMYLAEVISKRTYINEAKRRNLLSEEIDPDDESEMIEMSGMGDDDDGDNG